MRRLSVILVFGAFVVGGCGSEGSDAGKSDAKATATPTSESSGPGGY